ncbi:MAG: choice-of-anchor tandem repeat GloVer-containing protein, partial [Terriglobales bacterium]
GTLQLGNRDGAFATDTAELAQSGPVRLVNQANGLPVASELQPGAAQEVLPGVSLAQRQSGRSRHRNAKSQVQNGPEQVLYAFQGGTDGSSPSSGLIFDAAGNLYGETEGGGAYGGGTVFELSPSSNGGWTETVLYSFQGGSDGSEPSDGLVFDQAGNLYGTTLYGGANGGGTAFELSPNSNGGWTETVLYSFDANNQASTPQGVIFDQKGNLYGTALGLVGCGYKGDEYCGAVFELSPNSNGGGRKLLSRTTSACW